MPNRIIKESICSSEDIESLTAEEEIFYYRLWVNCDDYGRFDARQLMLKSKLYPLKKHVQADDIKPYLDSLLQKGLIELYGVKGILYGQVMAWDKHQQIRAKRSKYPSKSESDDTCNQMISDDVTCHRNPIQSNPIQSESKSESESGEKSPNQTTREGGNQTTKKTNIKQKTNNGTEMYFEQFYSQYPHPTERQRTLRNWNTALKHNTAEELLQAAKNYAESVKGREKQFIKTSSNFLGREKPYLDYIRVPQNSEPLKRREIIVEEIERE